MKVIKTLIVVTGLLCSAQAMACDVYIKVINQSGGHVDGVSVVGPHVRQSHDHDLDNGASFTYHATGSLFSCHGEYSIDSLAYGDKCNYDNITIDMKKDGRAYFVITSVTGGAACDVEAIKPSNSLNDSLNCVALYSQDNICDYDHWSEIYDHCETYSYPAMEKDNFLLNQIKAGKCSYDNWSNLYNQIYDRQ